MRRSAKESIEYLNAFSLGVQAAAATAPAAITNIFNCFMTYKYNYFLKALSLPLIVQYLRGGVLCVHLLDDPDKNPVLVEDKCPAQRTLYGFAVHLLFSPGAEVLKHLRRCVGKQCKREGMLCGKACMGFLAVFLSSSDIPGASRTCVPGFK